MDRLTQKLDGNGFELICGAQVEDAVNKLGKFENLLEALISEKDKIMCQMEKLKEEGKTKTVTYKQLIANKLLVTNMIDRFVIYGL